ncbi:helix-turn-helix domain-containing protein [Streptomyces gibsoniae]|uniref:Helix-turn-helix domain-containing protein n=1 Tax=Streptomyces gibsoniae TaxID=3075529 RepID=A0ABU2TWQ0_9ACTN|nr:helix-turn-helix domain-containing protein [Streptomyces sp. DSM 41699]MDT0465393.1 helix-turn-helix domain-containing protein [Streptomyces sp. DSM 41699]
MSAEYAERASRLPGAVVWTRGAARRPGVGEGAAVLPDGCMDLLWTEGRLLVAGPDTRAYRPGPGAQGPWAGVRFYPGTAPALLGVPAHELRDRRVDLVDLWPGAHTRRLVERVDEAPDPAAALEDLALRLAADAEPFDPLLRAVVVSLTAGRSVTATAESVGLGTRQLHRRSLTAFGYGPKTLARVLRLQRALALARADVPFAETAALAGFADQAHLSREVRELAGTPLTELMGR